MAAARREGQDGSQPHGNGREAVVMVFALVLLLTIGCIAFVLARPGRSGPAP